MPVVTWGWELATGHMHPRIRAATETLPLGRFPRQEFYAANTICKHQLGSSLWELVLNRLPAHHWS